MLPETRLAPENALNVFHKFANFEERMALIPN